MRQSLRSSLALFLGSSLIVACGGSERRPDPDLTYTSQAPASASPNNGAEQGSGRGPMDGTAVPASSGGTSGGKDSAATPKVPGGRVAEVQEADVYRIQNNKLFLLNTYRGFLVYDIADPKHPVRLARLPVYGYPVEMFVENNTVYALLSDVLSLTQVNGQLRFERRNTSQIVTIDISDPANPRLLQALDIAGQLREGVSRKIENTIYVVSYQPSGYWYYGWGPQNGQQPDEAAWVYSYDVSTPSSLRPVGSLQVFQGDSTSTFDPVTGESHTRSSYGVTLSATANAIMVVQNWNSYDYVPGGDKSSGDCGYNKSDQDSVISIVDVSNPTGEIRVAASFATLGALTDQFKQTYVHDAATGTGTYLGIFARNAWSGSGCNYTQQVQNTIEAWNIAGDGTAQRLSALDFGKPNETVRGSTFDVERKVAFAITARNTDPMYAISFADRKKLQVLSQINDLSGDMDLFRAVEGGQYLLAVGRDNGTACASYVNKTDAGVAAGGNWQISVSLIDVRDLAQIRLAQRKCLDVANAGWVSSAVTWNLDQAHKMIGMHSDGKSNVLTVPISYGIEDKSNGDWYWYRWETAVGIVSWDLSRHDVSLPPEQQNVIATHGRFVHPNGEVNRSVLFTHGSDSHREMLNISDTHLSFANLQNLDSPALDSVVEMAPADAAVYRFGDYLVEQVSLPSGDYSQTAYEFRVKPVGVDLENAPTLASFTVGQLSQVMRQGNLLVMFRAVPKQMTDLYGNSYPGYVSQVVVYDLSVPTAPKAMGSIPLPDDLSPGGYYRYYCGVGFYPGYYYGNYQSTASLSEGIAFLIASGSYTPKQVRLPDGSYAEEYEYKATYRLAFLDLRNPARPSVSDVALALPGASLGSLVSASLVADAASPASLYITYRVQTGATLDAQSRERIYSYASFAQRWQRSNGAWQSDSAVNIPGDLVRAWAGAGGERLFLTRDDVYSSKQYTSEQTGTYWQWFDTVTLNLLRQATANGKPAAQLLDTRAFPDSMPHSMVFDGDRIYIAAGSPYTYGYYPAAVGGGVAVDTAAGAGGTADIPIPAAPVDTSDHLAIVDMAQGKLALAYDLPTGLANLEPMGVHENKLFANLPGDGILVIDVANPAAPKGQSFYRILGWPSGIEFAGGNAYLPAWNYGTYRIDLTAPGNL
jgi:hypothetical protein